jgi:hypothetical protein
MTRAMIVLTACSLLTGCNTVPLPDTDICVINVPALHEYCYNIKRDYDANGRLKPSAKPMIRKYADEAAMLAGLNKGIKTNPDGWANFKAYARELRERDRKGH